MTIVAPKPNPLEQVESDNDGMSEAEVAAKHAEIQKDWRNGNAAKHFERELDSILATSPSSADGGGEFTGDTEALAREEEELLRALAAQMNEQLRGHYLEVAAARRDGLGQGYHLIVREKGTGRTWEFDVSYDRALAVAGQDERSAFTNLVGACVTQALETRRAFFARVNANVAIIQGN